MITLKIGDVIPRKINKPTNVYRIKVDLMHGDADQYSTCYKDVKNPADALVLYSIMKEHCDNYDCDMEPRHEIIDKWIKRVPNTTLSRGKYGLNALSDLWDGDCTCDCQRYAGLEDVDIYYFDENGVERYVNVGTSLEKDLIRYNESRQLEGYCPRCGSDIELVCDFDGEEEWVEIRCIYKSCQYFYMGKDITADPEKLINEWNTASEEERAN